MKEVKVEEAVGMVLCHDLTEIIPGKFKGCAFKKGHVIQQEDIERLLNIGKRNIYVWDLDDGYVHENDAAIRMTKAAIGKGIIYDEPKEGKVTLKAQYQGVLKINLDLLYQVNTADEICFSAIHGNKMVTEGKQLAGTRVIPLAVKEEVLEQFEADCKSNGPLIEVLPLKKAKIGLVTTGSEIKTGRIEDKFGPVLIEKAKELGAEIVGQVFSGDDAKTITKAILNFIEQGVDMVEVSGGMSVDPDDRTPKAIRDCKGEIITYGTPVLPGAMFMLSYVNNIPVVGLPGCVMYAKRTVYDLMVPRILTGERLEKNDFIRLAHGGLCMNCERCVYPDCGFGQ